MQATAFTWIHSQGCVAHRDAAGGAEAQRDGRSEIVARGYRQGEAELGFTLKAPVTVHSRLSPLHCLARAWQLR